MPTSSSPGNEPSPRPLPPSYNAPRQTPQPYIRPRPARQPNSTSTPRAFPAGTERSPSTNPEPPRKRGRREWVVLALIIAGIAVVGVSFVIYNAGRAERDDDGNIAEAGTVYTDELEVGDCLDSFEATTAIADVPAVPCSQPHDGEVVGTFDLTDGPYPDQQELFSVADVRCAELLHSYAPQAYSDALVGVTYLYPTESSWREHRDRTVNCIATALAGPVSGRLTER